MFISLGKISRIGLPGLKGRHIYSFIKKVSLFPKLEASLMFPPAHMRFLEHHVCVSIVVNLFDFSHAGVQYYLIALIYISPYHAVFSLFKNGSPPSDFSMGTAVFSFAG